MHIISVPWQICNIFNRILKFNDVELNLLNLRAFWYTWKVSLFRKNYVNSLPILLQSLYAEFKHFYNTKMKSQFDLRNCIWKVHVSLFLYLNNGKSKFEKPNLVREYSIVYSQNVFSTDCNHPIGMIDWLTK